MSAPNEPHDGAADTRRAVVPLDYHTEHDPRSDPPPPPPAPDPLRPFHPPLAHPHRRLLDYYNDLYEQEQPDPEMVAASRRLDETAPPLAGVWRIFGFSLLPAGLLIIIVFLLIILLGLVRLIRSAA